MIIKDVLGKWRGTGQSKDFCESIGRWVSYMAAHGGPWESLATGHCARAYEQGSHVGGDSGLFPQWFYKRNRAKEMSWNRQSSSPPPK